MSKKKYYAVKRLVGEIRGLITTGRDPVDGHEIKRGIALDVTKMGASIVGVIFVGTNKKKLKKQFPGEEISEVLTK